MSLDLKISVITINYNNAAGLERTIQSVINQTYKNIEYIVVDGGSADGSSAIIEQYKDRLSYAVSEPDKGIFNAMNKGIAAATGDYLLFINSGDELVSNAIVTEALSFTFREDLVYGNLIFDNDGIRRTWIPESKLTFKTFFKETIPHPSTFIKRDLFDRIGQYNEAYKIVADWEFFMVAVCRYNCTYQHINLSMTLFFEGGVSSNPESYKALMEERNHALESHFSTFIKDYRDWSVLEQEFSKIAYYAKWRHALKDFFKMIGIGPGK